MASYMKSIKLFLTLAFVVLAGALNAAEPAANPKLAHLGPLGEKMDATLIPALEALQDGKASGAAMTRGPATADWRARFQIRPRENCR